MSKCKVALISGVTGQDGSWLADFLLTQNYDVYGLVRQTTQFTPDKWGYLNGAMKNESFHVVHGDMCDTSFLRSLIEHVKPDEVYNLAAQSHVGMSFEQPVNTTDVTALGPLRLLEAIRCSKNDCKFYQASSSEMFGKVRETPQNELTPFYPRSPYGCAKVYGHYITQNYREAYGIFACSGIMFNHESERRGENFVTRKITKAVSRIKLGKQKELFLGNTDIKRDWGYAPDYVGAMWLMMQQDSPDDYVIGTGVGHTVQEFVDAAFNYVGLNSADYVRLDPAFIRPAEVDTLLANSAKAQSKLGWQPCVEFDDLVKRMVDHDMMLTSREDSK